MKFFYFKLMMVLAAAVLAGCAQAPKQIYAWGKFSEQQYAYLKGEAIEPQIAALEKQREEARVRNEKLPPGFHAHLGLLYGKTGRDDLMLEQLNEEKAAFPEAAVYIDHLLSKVKKQ